MSTQAKAIDNGGEKCYNGDRRKPREWRGGRGAAGQLGRGVGASHYHNADFFNETAGAEAAIGADQSPRQDKDLVIPSSLSDTATRKTCEIPRCLKKRRARGQLNEQFLFSYVWTKTGIIIELPCPGCKTNHHFELTKTSGIAQ